MTAIANVILAAAEAGYIDRGWWAAWADRRLLSLGVPAPAWLLNLSLARSVEELYDALQPQLDAEHAVGVNRPTLIVGFMHLQFQEGRIALAPMLEAVAQEVDGVSVEGMSPELVNLALREARGEGASSSARLDRVLHQLQQLGAAAHEALSEVENTDHLEVQP